MSYKYVCYSNTMTLLERDIWVIKLYSRVCRMDIFGLIWQKTIRDTPSTMVYTAGQKHIMFKSKAF